jgi:hypothetical protein
MRFKGVGGEGKRGPKRIKLVCWGVVGEGSEAEVNAGQGDVGLKGGEAQVESIYNEQEERVSYSHLV